MLKSKVHFWTLQILFVLLIIFVTTKVSFVFQPFIVFISTLFFPMLIAGILYFIFNPVVRLLEKKIPRTLSILLIYLLFIGLLAFISASVGPIITSQVTGLFNNLPDYIKQIQALTKDLSHSQWFTWMMNQDYVSISKIEQSLTSFLQNLPQNITSSLSAVFGVVTNITLVIITVPFILFTC